MGIGSSPLCVRANKFCMMSNIYIYILLSETQVDNLIEYVCRNYGNSNGKESDNKIGPAQQVIILLPFALTFAPSFNCLPALGFVIHAL
jgi:hypothetical protein